MLHLVKLCAFLSVALVVGAGAADVKAPPFGTRWYMGNKGYHFKQDSTLVKWEPKHPEVILTHIEPRKLKDVGDKVNFKFRWMSDGQDQCPQKDFSHGKYCEAVFPCAHHSVSCLAGTGDFRIGFFDSITGKAGKVTDDGFADANRYGNMNKQLAGGPFKDYRGYHFRLYPHISHKATRYVDRKTGSHIPCGFYIKDDHGLFSSHRINDSHGCFGLKPGKWGTLKFQIKKTKKDTFELSWEMNGYAYATEHVYKQDDYKDKFMPGYVDTVAIMYPNGRRFYYIEFASDEYNEEKDINHFGATARAEGGATISMTESAHLTSSSISEDISLNATVVKHADEKGLLEEIVEEAVEMLTTGKTSEGASAKQEESEKDKDEGTLLPDSMKDEIPDEAEKRMAAEDTGEDEIDKQELKISYQHTAALKTDPLSALLQQTNLFGATYSDFVLLGFAIIGLCGLGPSLYYVCGSRSSSDQDTVGAAGIAPGDAPRGRVRAAAAPPGVSRATGRSKAIENARKLYGIVGS